MELQSKPEKGLAVPAWKLVANFLPHSLLLTPWPRHSKLSMVTTTSSWDFSPTPTAPIAAMSTSPCYTYRPPLPSDDGLYKAKTQMTYSTIESNRAPLSCPPSSSRSMISGASLRPDDSVSYLGGAKDQSTISNYYYNQLPVQTPPSLLPPSIPSQWLIIAPPTIYSVIALPPPGYILWAPISQPPGLTFFKPSDTKPKDGNIEASPIPSDWQYRNTNQREHWVEMTIFQKIPIIRKRSHWRCGLKGCKWTIEGSLLPTIATKYLVHQFEMHECWWSRSEEGRVHLNRLNQSLLL